MPDTQSNPSRRSLLAMAVAGGAAAGVFPAPEAAAQAAAASDPPFGLGTVSYNVPKDWDLATLCKILPSTGLPAVEFRTTHAHGVEPGLNAAQRAAIKSQCRDAGFKQLSLGSVCEFQSPDAAVVRKNVEDCRAWIELARDIGALGVKVRPNGLPKEVPIEKTLEQIAYALKVCGRMAADNGVEIWVEVHGGGTSEPGNMRKIMDLCAHPAVGVNWNSNATDLANGSVRAAFELLKDRLMSVHINNLWGDYPYRELFRLLREARFSRYTLCEVAGAVRPEDGALFFQCYRGLWRELARG